MWFEVTRDSDTTTDQDAAKPLEVNVADFNEPGGNQAQPGENRSAEQTSTAGGWTVRQIVHHVADRHLNSYTRLPGAHRADTCNQNV
jgi:hypothetical protein